MPVKSPILTGTDILKTYPAKTGEGALTVLDHCSITINSGDIVSVVGPSGSGKSTLLHVLGGLDRPDSGEVAWKSNSIYNLTAEELADFRNRELGFVFQFHHLLPEFSALENVLMPALIAGRSLEASEERAMELLSRFGIPDRAEHRPTELSGGEQQRVSMARALMNNPSLILADEPTGNLDDANTRIVLDYLFQLREEDGVSILLITHEKDIAGRCDLTYELNKGRLNPFN
ncbi:ABC transporter ATP-binding protein [Halalkalibaculum sp. DA3122]|uniref:ABC transporter ATP-binding protein n=1 Tax=Halalkalibaculum sp. DA3122 TaxID=3373607 RepID=UPI003753FEBA